MNQTTLQEIIADKLRHPRFAECAAVVEDAVIIHAQDPEHHRKELKRYRKMEDTAQLDQRVRLYNPVTAPMLSPTYSYLSYIWRCDGIKINVVQPNDTVRDVVEDNYSRFFGELSLHEYLYQAVTHYNKYDPNAWIGYERREVFDGDRLARINIYPVEFGSDEVIHYEMDENGRVQQLTALRHFDAVDERGHKVENLELYFHYYPGGVTVAAEVQRGATWHGVTDDFETVEWLRERKPVTFAVVDRVNGTTEVPFFRAGAFDHPEYRNEVKALFIHDSTGLVKDILRDTNFLAVQKAVHCFPEKSEYVKRCQAVNDQGEACHGGYYGGIRDNDHVCGSCKGTGIDYVASEQEVRRLGWPDSAEDVLELSKLSHYHERPLNIAEFYVAEIDRQANLVFSTTYNQNQLTPVGGPRTATEVNLNADLINNKLSPVASRIEDGFELAYRIAFQYYGATNEADVEMTHPDDFKVLTVDELIQQHKDAVDAKLPAAVRNSITRDILRKQYRNFPYLLRDIEAFEAWRPWKDKAPEEVALIVSLRSENDFYRQLWENWEAVTETVRYNLDDNGTPRFYLMARKMQLEALRDAIAQVRELSEYEAAPEPVGVDPFEEVIIE